MVDVAPMASPIYGPVRSWRFGNSLGVDLLLRTSICSFDCVYCQLGRIVEWHDNQAEFVPTARVAEELAKVDWSAVDVVTFSGSGEPTLATNLGEVIALVKDTYARPVTVLTNCTMLGDAATRARLMRADTVACKLDAVDEEGLRRLNRPVAGVTLASIVAGIKALRTDGFAGKLALQVMLMPMSGDIATRLADLVAEIAPDEVELNTPTRPHPREHYLESRGNHTKVAPVAFSMLKTMPRDELGKIGEVLRARCPGLVIRTVYDTATERLFP